MTGTAQNRKAAKVQIVDRIVQTAPDSINPTISFWLHGSNWQYEAVSS